MRRVPLVAAILLGLTAAVAGRAEEPQGKAPPDPPARSSIEEFIAERGAREGPDGAASEDPALVLPDAAGLQQLDPTTRKEALAAVREYYRYRVSGFRHRRQVFDWQLFSSKIIFFVVILLVTAGIYFSGVQFHAALRKPDAPVGGELEASLSGIKVSSPVLGVIILVISFLFFYLYLVHVHPISEIF